MKEPQTLDKHLISFMGINALRASHPGVRKLKRQQQGHSAHGNKVWRSSFVLMDYLSSWEIPERAKVLDIGCGWGSGGDLSGKKLSGAGHRSGYRSEKVQPYLNLQAEINNCSVEFTPRSFQSLQKTELANYPYADGYRYLFLG